MGWADELITSSSGDFEEVSPQDFYRAIFGNSRSYAKYLGNLEVPLTMSDYDGDGGGTWRSVRLDDLPSIVENRSDAYVSPCTYFPKRSKDGRYHSTNSLDTADQLCAFVLDIDYPDTDVFRNCLEILWPTEALPCPTYIVCSGNGLHFYFVLDWPVDMMRRWRMELSSIKDHLGSIYSTGNPSFSLIEDLDSDSPKVSDVNSVIGKFDNHGLTQSFRVVGSLTKDGEETVTAWRIGSTWDIDDLAAMAGLTQKFTVEDFDLSSSMQTKAWEAEKERVENIKAEGGKRKGWNPGLYKWLSFEVVDRAKYYGTYGNRYWQVLCLTIAARKDNIPQQQLEKDVAEAYKVWNECAERWHHPRITWSECQKAMRSGYKCDSYMVKKFKKDWLSDKCGWKWESHQKRNGLTQSEHLADCRELKFIRAKRKPECLGGRPAGSKDKKQRKNSKKESILRYAAAYPNASHSEIARALGVSRPTVIKWLRQEK